jgi:hypothetical protein
MVMRAFNHFNRMPKAHAIAQLNASQARLRRMDLTVMAPEQTMFDPYMAAGRESPIEVVRDQDRLEMMHMAEPGKLMYAVGRMLSIGRWPYKTEAASSMWHAYARRVFDAAVEAANPEACAVVALSALAEFAVRNERQRARAAASNKRALKRSPEARSESAKKAAVTRKKNMVERKTAHAALSGTDSAMDAVLASVDALMTEGT